MEASVSKPVAVPFKMSNDQQSVEVAIRLMASSSPRAHIFESLVTVFQITGDEIQTLNTDF